MPPEEINVGVVVAHSATADSDALRALFDRVTTEVGAVLEEGTGRPWHFHHEEPTLLESDDPRRPSDFLEQATLRMAEGPYDLVVILTNVGLFTRKQRVVAGLASPVTRVAVISTRKLVATPRGEPLRTIDDPAVGRNLVALLLHLLGHVMGLPHRRDEPPTVMSPFEFAPDRETIPRFTGAADLPARAARLPERTHRAGGIVPTLLFHVWMAVTHPWQVVKPLLRNRAFFIPLALPGLATAAVAPTLLLVFTAEIWDAGLSMPNRTAILYATVTILAATIYLLLVQNLFMPRKEKRLITEHMAVVNVTIFLSMLLAVIGLFTMVAGLMLAIQFFIFPEGLMRTWPTLEGVSEFTWPDQIRLAAFISTIGTATGALAGGFESRAVVRHLALFLDEP